MNVFFPYISAILIFAMLFLLFVVLIWAGIENLKMQEKFTVVVFFIMAAALAAIIVICLALIVERGL